MLNTINWHNYYIIYEFKNEIVYVRMYGTFKTAS